VSAADAIATLLARREPGQTICPSEAARLLTGSEEDWRAHMAQVHDAARQLAADGHVRLTWRGQETSGADGPYRIAAS
jgi:hypothetical protein